MKHLFTVCAVLSLVAAPALAEVPVYEIIIKDHKFQPAEVTIPADTKVKLLVKNQDATVEEFESHDLNREKVIKGGTEAPVFVGPLKSGQYKFFGEFNPATAQGVLTVK